MGDKVCNVVLDILQGLSMYPALNFTHIALIHKKDNLEFANDVRPISLCNVIYKLVSKVSCNIFKTMMPLIISMIQSAIILDRLITDNIMVVAYELWHSMKLNKKKKEGSMAINLDMSKAYNRIEWPYLQAIMAIMGFTNHWIRLIITCVTPIHYSVLVNCSPRETFTHSFTLPFSLMCRVLKFLNGQSRETRGVEGPRSR